MEIDEDFMLLQKIYATEAGNSVPWTAGVEVSIGLCHAVYLSWVMQCN